MIGRCAVMSAAAVVFVSGCQQGPPTGNSGGRVDPYRQTDADRFSPEVSSVTLLEFADRVTEQLARRIPRVAEIAENPSKIALEMGAIENQTSTPTSDFSRIRRRVFLNMANADSVLAVADVYERPELMDEQARRFVPSGDGSLVSGSPAVETNRYDPADTYLLQGSFGEIKRGRSQSTFIFDMTLTNLASRRIVFAEQFESKEIR